MIEMEQYRAAEARLGAAMLARARQEGHKPAPARAPQPPPEKLGVRQERFLRAVAEAGDWVVIDNRLMRLSGYPSSDFWDMIRRLIGHGYVDNMSRAGAVHAKVTPLGSKFIGGTNDG